MHEPLPLSTIRRKKGFRVYQVRGDGNRHFTDLRFVPELPATEKIKRVLSPSELIANKVIS